MVKKSVLICVALLLVLVLSSLSYASCGMCATDKKSKEEIVNTTCPVMGGEVSNDTPHKVTYDGKIVGFCCSACVDIFKKEPEKYMAELSHKD